MEKEREGTPGESSHVLNLESWQHDLQPTSTKAPVLFALDHLQVILNENNGNMRKLQSQRERERERERERGSINGWKNMEVSWCFASCDAVFIIPVVNWLSKAKRIWTTWKKQPQDVRKEYVVSHCAWMVFG